MADILELLSTFGSAFTVQVQLNSDSTSAIHIPEDWLQEMTSTQCASRCDSLPGPWHIMTYQGFIEHFSLLRETIATGANSAGSAPSSFFWQLNPGETGDHRYSTHGVSYRISATSCYGTYFPNDDCSFYNWASESFGQNPGSENLLQCLCELRQRPRVEYDFCEGIMADVQACSAEKFNQGWYPLELVSSGNSFVQTMWRWED